MNPAEVRAGRQPHDTGPDGKCPDATWLAGVTAALTWWAAEGWRLSTHPAPTSQVLGTGAVAVAERLFEARWGGRAIMTPSNTAGTIAALLAVGVADRDVLVQPMEWHSTWAAVAALGGRPVSLDVPPGRPVTAADISRSLAGARRPRGVVLRPAAVLLAHHPHHEYSHLRERWPRLSLLEDAATAPTTPPPAYRTAGTPDIALHSFGPGKDTDVGEGGMINTHSARLYLRCMHYASHPARALEAGISADPAGGDLHTRPHPVAAVLLAHALRP